jgi:hypothetical protein
MTTIGIDNGTSGSIGILNGEGTIFEPTPIKEHLHYTKAGKFIKRIDILALEALINRDGDIKAYIERPFTGAFVNTAVLAGRAYEATLIALEEMGIGYETIDSKAWQKALLPGVKGSANLKKASKLRGIELYPQLKQAIMDHGDADGLLIAHYYHEYKAQQ